jgi:hypothetical protein
LSLSTKIQECLDGMTHVFFSLIKVMNLIPNISMQHR